MFNFSHLLFGKWDQIQELLFQQIWRGAIGKPEPEIDECASRDNTFEGRQYEILQNSYLWNWSIQYSANSANLKRCYWKTKAWNWWLCYWRQCIWGGYMNFISYWNLTKPLVVKFGLYNMVFTGFQKSAPGSCWKCESASFLQILKLQAICKITITIKIIISGAFRS